MNARKSIGEMTWKLMLACLLVVLAFQGFGMSGLAAPAPRLQDIQEGEPQPLTCGCPSVTDKIVILIDDSGSMQRANDRGGNRRALATELLDIMFALQGDRDSRLKDLQIGVIHFSDHVKQHTEELITVTAGNIEDLKNTINLEPVSRETTNFEEPFLKAIDLLEAKGDCTRKSIVLFTDGTPEDETGRLTGSKLEEVFTNLGSYSKGIPGLDGIYVIGFKANAGYLSEDVKTRWFNLIRNWSDLRTKLATSQATIPRLFLYSSNELSSQLDDLKEKSTTQSNSKINFDELLKYQNLEVKFDSDLNQLQQGVQSTIKFTLVNDSGDVVMPGGDLSNVLSSSNGSPSPVVWNVSVQDIPLKEEPNGVDYAFPYTPESSGINQIHIVYSLKDGRKDNLLDCSGIVSVIVKPKEPIPVQPIKISLVIGSPLFPDDETVTFPMELNYEGNIAPATSIHWDPSASTANRSLAASVSPGSATPGKYLLTVKPIGDAREILAEVKPTINIDGQDIRIPDTKTSAELACTYDKTWDVWFWPLVIVLAGLLILLLVLRMRDGRTQKDYQQARSDRFWIRKWRFLFVPFLILLSFLVLNRLWWCYIIPWWLFFASTLGLLVVAFPLVYFVREERHRVWVLLALLLIAISLVVVVSITIDRRLLWPLVILLLLTVIGRWYVRPDEVPDPDPGSSVEFRLVSVPACVPFNKSITLPLRFDYQEGGKLLRSLPWVPSAEVLPDGKSQARIQPVDAENGKYELVIDPVKYDKDTREIQVKINVSADLDDGHSVKIPDQTITIGLCPPDDLADLEGIGEKVQDLLYQHGILTFKQLARTQINTLNELLDNAGWKMMDAKTWPQQAKLTAIAREYDTDESRQNYENYMAYKAWVKDGIEPDEYDLDEEDRRELALPWNGIPQFTPLVLSLALSPSSAYRKEPIVLPVHLNRNADKVRLEAVEWKVSVWTLPDAEDVQATVKPVSEEHGTYELVIDPVQNLAVRQIQVSLQALVHGRSIEIYYGKALTVQVNPVPAADDLADLEGVGPATQKLLNEKDIYTFEQLSKADNMVLKQWLDEANLNMMDAKTWPQQAKLAYVANKYGSEVDQRSYEAYKAWLKDGIEPDEYEKDEDDRREAALVWHGTAELTEKAYPEIFKKQ